MIGLLGLVKSVTTRNWSGWGIFMLGLVLTPIYLNHMADPGKPKRDHLILSTIAFVVWAYVTTGKQLPDPIFPALFDQALGSIILVAFSLISAVIPLNK